MVTVDASNSPDVRAQNLTVRLGPALEFGSLGEISIFPGLFLFSECRVYGNGRALRGNDLTRGCGVTFFCSGSGDQHMLPVRGDGNRLGSLKTSATKSVWEVSRLPLQSGELTGVCTGQWPMSFRVLSLDDRRFAIADARGEYLFVGTLAACEDWLDCRERAGCTGTEGDAEGGQVPRAESAVRAGWLALLKSRLSAGWAWLVQLRMRAK